MDSLWSKNTVLPEFEPLREDLKTDVLIIGGGMAGILPGLRIYEKTRVVSIDGKEAITDRGKKIVAQKMIFATHFPIVNTRGFYFMKMYQQRSYVIALQNAQTVKGMFLDEALGGYSFRNADGLLLLGGAGLYDAGQNSLYRTLCGQEKRVVRGHGLSKMGHDLLHGGRAASDGSGAGKRKSRRACLCAGAADEKTAACPKRHRSGVGLDARFPKKAPPHGMRAEMERGRAQLGLSLSRPPVRRRREAAGESRRQGSVENGRRYE